jgi:hypothetical protein
MKIFLSLVKFLRDSMDEPSFHNCVFVIGCRTPFSDAFQAEDMVTVFQKAESWITLSPPYHFQADAARLLLTTLGCQGIFARLFLLLRTCLEQASNVECKLHWAVFFLTI